mmetsp:Transcript_14737/g.62194  ORF Transcript_14737/g.62194 Transcript_14737/m.62194 type:complete len:202 (+) Transcript_14737:192-797(+)
MTKKHRSCDHRDAPERSFERGIQTIRDYAANAAAVRARVFFLSLQKPFTRAALARARDERQDERVEFSRRRGGSSRRDARIGRRVVVQYVELFQNRIKHRNFTQDRRDRGHQRLGFDREQKHARRAGQTQEPSFFLFELGDALGVGAVHVGVGDGAVRHRVRRQAGADVFHETVLEGEEKPAFFARLRSFQVAAPPARDLR